MFYYIQLACSHCTNMEFVEDKNHRALLFDSIEAAQEKVWMLNTPPVLYVASVREISP